jgi:hypothetical protein
LESGSPAHSSWQHAGWLLDDGRDWTDIDALEVRDMWKQWARRQLPVVSLGGFTPLRFDNQGPWMKATCAEHETCAVKYKLLLAGRGEVLEETATRHSLPSRVLRHFSESPVTVADARGVREVLGTPEVAARKRPIAVNEQLASPVPSDYIRAVKAKIVSAGTDDGQPANQRKLLEWIEPRKWTLGDVSPPLPADTTQLSVVWHEVRRQYVSLAFITLRFHEHISRVVKAFIEGGGVFNGVVGQVDFAGSIVFHEYTIGIFVVQLYRRHKDESLKKVAIPAMMVMSPTEDGDHYGLLLLWGRTLLRVFLLLLGVVCPPQLLYQVHGDWTSALRAVVFTHTKHLVVDLEHLFRSAVPYAIELGWH